MPFVPMPETQLVERVASYSPQIGEELDEPSVGDIAAHCFAKKILLVLSLLKLLDFLTQRMTPPLMLTLCLLRKRSQMKGL